MNNRRIAAELVKLARSIMASNDSWNGPSITDPKPYREGELEAKWEELQEKALDGNKEYQKYLEKVCKRDWDEVEHHLEKKESDHGRKKMLEKGWKTFEMDGINRKLPKGLKKGEDGPPAFEGSWN